MAKTSFPILRFAEANSVKFDLFFDPIQLKWHLYEIWSSDLVDRDFLWFRFKKQTCKQNLNRLWRHRKNKIIFYFWLNNDFKYGRNWSWRHCDDVINSKLISLLNFDKHHVPHANFSVCMTFSSGVWYPSFALK